MEKGELWLRTHFRLPWLGPAAQGTYPQEKLLPISLTSAES